MLFIVCEFLEVFVLFVPYFQVEGNLSIQEVDTNTN